MKVDVIIGTQQIHLRLKTKLNFQLLVCIQVIRMQIYIRNNAYCGTFSGYKSGDFLPEKTLTLCFKLHTLSISCYDFPSPLLEEKKNNPLSY